MRGLVGTLTRTSFVGFILLSAVAARSLPAERAEGEPPPEPQEPNILLILSDDQRFDLLAQMPNVVSLIVNAGVTFTNSFVVDPLCCPSRTSTLRGQYPHTTGVWQVGGPYGGWKRVKQLGLEPDSLAPWLDAAGYETAFFGKYMNGYSSLQPYRPPGWDEWYAFDNRNNNDMYFNYFQSVNGTAVWHGAAPQDYSTDVIAAQASSVIRATSADAPLFLAFWPRAPHAPTTPAPRYAGTTCPVPPPPIPPSANEADVSDKPAYVRAYPVGGKKQWVNTWTKQCLALRATDDAVATVVQALADTGRLANTLILITSDNGLMNGEHRWAAKKVPYESSIRVPLVVRYDPLATAGTSDPHLVTNLDHAATILDAAGATATIPLEGLSLMPLLRGEQTVWRSEFVIEGYDVPSAPQGGNYVPTYCGLRTEQEKYVRYVTGESEYYDLATDPYELVNRANDPGTAERVSILRTRLAELCSPRPPGMPSI